MDKILEKFSMYDFLGYFLPGSIVLFVLNNRYLDFSTILSTFSFNSEVFLAIYFVILSYSIGMLSHEFSELIQKYLLSPLWGGLPSERFLSDKDKKYTIEYKEKIRNKINADFGILTGNDKKINQEAFNLIYSKVQKGSGNQRIQLFNSIYGMNRNIISGIVICIFLGTLKYFEELNSSDWFSLDILNKSIIILVIILVFRRAKRFSERFADYVFRDYMNM